MLDWDDLRIFLAAARLGSFSAAAGRLAMDGTTVARRLSRLEAAVHGTLFVRSPQGLLLTPAGHRLLESSAEVERARPRELSKAFFFEKKKQKTFTTPHLQRAGFSASPGCCIGGRTGTACFLPCGSFVPSPQLLRDRLAADDRQAEPLQRRQLHGA